MVGAAYASRIATRTPEPSAPMLDIPYAPLICAGTYPQGAYGWIEPNAGGSPAAYFSPKYFEQGGALTNASGGGATPSRFGLAPPDAGGGADGAAVRAWVEAARLTPGWASVRARSPRSPG